MNRGNRYQMIRTIRDHLQSMDFDDAELLAASFEVHEADEWHGSFQERLLETANEELLSLYSYIQGEDAARHNIVPAEPEKLRVFASHLSLHRAFVASYESEFSKYGIELFVAHDSIGVNEVWAETIKTNLATVHAGVVFFDNTDNHFASSQWCDQEVGWLLGRGVPMVTLKYGQGAPYGPLGTRQAFELRNLTPQAVVSTILNKFREHPSIAPHLAESLTIGMLQSPNYLTTDLIWEQLAGVRGLTQVQVERLSKAAQENNQVYGANCFSDRENRGYKLLIEELIAQQASQQGSFR